MIDENLGYRIGYGETKPQIGYGKAQVAPNTMAEGIQQGIQNFDIWQQRADADKKAAAKLKREQEKSFKETLAELDPTNLYTSPYLKKGWDGIVSDSVEAINSLDFSTDPYTATAKAKAIINSVKTKRKVFDSAQEAWDSARDADLTKTFRTPQFDAIISGEEVDIDGFESDSDFVKASLNASVLDPRVDFNEVPKKVEQQAKLILMDKDSERYNVSTIGDMDVYRAVSELDDSEKEIIRRNLQSTYGGAWVRQAPRLGLQGDLETFNNQFIEPFFVKKTSEKTYKKDGEDNDRGDDKDDIEVSYDKIYTAKTYTGDPKSGYEESGEINWAATEAVSLGSGLQKKRPKGDWKNNITFVGNKRLLDGEKIGDIIQPIDLIKTDKSDPNLKDAPEKAIYAKVSVVDDGGNVLEYRDALLPIDGLESFLKRNYKKEYEAFIGNDKEVGKQEVKEVTSQEEYEALPDGAEYIWNGQKLVKGK